MYVRVVGSEGSPTDLAAGECVRLDVPGAGRRPGLVPLVVGVLGFVGPWPTGLVQVVLKVPGAETDEVGVVVDSIRTCNLEDWSGTRSASVCSVRAKPAPKGRRLC